MLTQKKNCLNSLICIGEIDFVVKHIYFTKKTPSPDDFTSNFCKHLIKNKPLNLSEPQFPHPQNVNNNSVCPIRIL